MFDLSDFTRSMGSGESSEESFFGRSACLIYDDAKTHMMASILRMVSGFA